MLLVPTIQQSESAIHKKNTPSFFYFLPIQVPQSIDESSLCYTIDSHQFILYQQYGFPSWHQQQRTHLPYRRRKKHILIPGLGRSPGGGHGNPHQYSCLENPMDRGPGSLVVYGPEGGKELDTTEVTSHTCTRQQYIYVNLTPSSPSLCPYVCFPRLCLYLCFVNKVTDTFVLDPTYMGYFMIFVFRHLPYFILYDSLGPSTLFAVNS